MIDCNVYLKTNEVIYTKGFLIEKGR